MITAWSGSIPVTFLILASPVANDVVSLYKDGKRIAELNGYVSADELVEFLKENKVI